MKKNIILMIIGLIITGAVFAQKQNHGNPEFRAEMQNYIEKNIAPVLQKKQDEFDAKLSAEDRTFIKAERTEAKAEREEHRTKRKAAHKEFKKENPELLEKRKAMREEWKNMTEEERKAKKTEWKNLSEEERQTKIQEKREIFGKHKRPHNPELQGERKAKRTEMKAFISRNQDVVAATMEDLKPLYEKWIADQMEIIKKYHPEKAAHLANKEGRLPTGLFGISPKGHHKKGHRGKGNRMHKRGKEAKETTGRRGKRGKRGFGKHKRLPVEFVLWDGSTPMEAQTRDNAPNISNNTKTEDINLGQNFPNPAKSITRIQLELPNEMANLDLTITDLQGKVVKRVNLTNLNAGSETIELNVSNLPNGQYFYSIEGKGIKTTKKMTVNH